MSGTRPSNPYPLRVPENLMELAEAKGRTERTDRSTALQQLLYAGAEEYVMALLSEGRVSAGKAAEILDTSVHRIHELAREHSVELGAEAEDYQRSRKSTAGLLK